MANNSIWGFYWASKLVFKIIINLTYIVGFHLLYQSLDLAYKFPEEERKSVLLRKSP